MLSYTVLAHTADTGIEATAPSLPELIRVLASGMFNIMATVDPCPPGQEVEMSVIADTNEDLVLDALSEVLYRSEVEGLFFCQFDVEAIAATGVRVRARGMPAEDAELTGPPIKAATYHDLNVIETDEGWRARVYFDV